MDAGAYEARTSIHSPAGLTDSRVIRRFLLDDVLSPRMAEVARVRAMGGGSVGRLWEHLDLAVGGLLHSFFCSTFSMTRFSLFFPMTPGLSVALQDQA